MPEPKRTIERDADDPTKLHVVVTCPECGEKFRSPAFDDAKLFGLRSDFVQRVFPDWSPADRELYFMSGLCGKCWDKVRTPTEDDNA